ncbi:type II toxin-antitoxin system RelE/ParE family toxin [Pseudacidovorax intermedius]|uniref:ParE-like toxin of type II ParDE toxin-antitoxin system n=1 Tax=Pseudacidovorax intermedius TaxID=433924 RepID=A0A370F9J9_9BURK|nr:type II toxin-antitoxin system RelE/ParE family toxin [Pseudacidovorax intermedius]RDI19629.1 ParE-like toxin of type II ParDE toxin-antitoxin system [Pseudacidovorax intermedius]
MTRIELAPEVLDDLERFVEHLEQHSADGPLERMQEILEAFDVLAHSPAIGRPVKDGKRELVIGKGSQGYVALYRYVASVDTIFVLALRAQRESGFKH